ncbi:MAG: hypothetical protein Q8L60_12680 [Gammaproteobacteria bacterium]|nr:hypothetical protein [Gammaproteobacteria bacterium]MDP2348474.1 hypothetical protein [Gammaproteobacteria bacterium]
MMKAIVLLAILVAGCSSPQSGIATRSAPAPRPTVASEAEMDAANQRSMACLLKYASELDDGSTDVNVIVRAVTNSCRREREQFFSVAIRGHGPLDQNAAMNAVLEKDTEAATYFILSNRADNR